MVFHKDLLQETLDEIENMFFWKDEIELDESKYIVIHDFEQAYASCLLIGIMTRKRSIAKQDSSICPALRMSSSATSFS